MNIQKVSLITVSFNSEKTIRDTIESVLCQDYKYIEYIIIDGGSTDSTLDIIKSFGSQIQTVVSEEDAGIYDAMNKGVALSTGDVIGIINSDDFYPENNIISTIVKVFQANCTSELVLGGIDFVKHDDIKTSIRKYSSKYFMPWMMRFGIMPPHPGAFISRDVYARNGKYKLDYTIAADYDLLLRILLVDKTVYTKIDQTLVRMRLGGVSTAGISSFRVISREILRSLKENNVYSNSLFIFLRVVSKIKQILFK
jgi:glycosyltransferase involved in cell wall biosynthesis